MEYFIIVLVVLGIMGFLIWHFQIQDVKDDTSVVDKDVLDYTLEVDSELADAIFDAVNSYRRDLGLPALIFNVDIKSEADIHSRYMATVNHIIHENFFERSDYFKELGASRVSENLAYNCRTADEAVSLWHNSVPHRTNMKDAGFTHSAVSVVRNKHGVPYTTQIFIKK